MEIIIYNNLLEYTESKFTDLNVSLPLQSYITSVLSGIGFVHLDSSVTVAYAEAKFNYQFEGFQQVGDYILFIKSNYPDYLKNASREYYDAVAQSAYYRCYLILNKQWKLYEELADNFPKIIENIRGA